MQATDFIPIRNPSRLPNFPESLDLRESEAFTQQTWKELFQNAVKHHVPCYVIGIVPLPQRSPNEKQRYKIYDGIILNNYVLERRGMPVLDLETREEIPIGKIHYLAVMCFKLDPHEVKPAPLYGQAFNSLFPNLQSEITYVKQTYLAQHKSWRGLTGEEQDYRRAQAASLREIYPCFDIIDGKVTDAVAKINDYLLDSANFHSSNHEAIGQIQFIVANQWEKLLDEAQARIWNWCSKENLQKIRQPKKHTQ